MTRRGVLSAIAGSVLPIGVALALAFQLGVSDVQAQVVPCEGDCGGEEDATCTYIGTTKSCNLCYIIPSMPPILMYEGTWFHYYTCTLTLPDGTTYTYNQTSWEGRGCGIC